MQFPCLIDLAGFQRAIVEEGEHLIGIARTRCARIDEERVADKVAQGYRWLGAQQRMARRQGDDQPFVAQQDASHVWIFIAYAAKPDIDAAVLERLDLVHGRHLVHGQIDHRVLRAKAPDDLRQHPIQR